MSSDLKKTSRLFFESMSRGDLDTIENEVLDPTARIHFPGMPETIDVRTFRQVGDAYLQAFPDCKITVQDQIAEGDTVVSRVIFEGTQTGPLQAIPPTGRKVRSLGVSIDRYAGGKVIERWEVFDQLGMLIQLGVAPMPNQV